MQTSNNKVRWYLGTELKCCSSQVDGQCTSRHWHCRWMVNRLLHISHCNTQTRADASSIAPNKSLLSRVKGTVGVGALVLRLLVLTGEGGFYPSFLLNTACSTVMSLTRSRLLAPPSPTGRLGVCLRLNSACLLEIVN